MATDKQSLLLSRLSCCLWPFEMGFVPPVCCLPGSSKLLNISKVRITYLFLLLLLKGFYLFIWKAERLQREGESERGLGFIDSLCRGPLQPGLGGLLHGCRALCCFPRQLPSSWVESVVTRAWTGIRMGCWCYRCCVLYCSFPIYKFKMNLLNVNVVILCLEISD